MTTKKEISIILAVYNVAPYILKCLKSIKDQTFDGYKLILVDDCGTDNSIAIAAHFLSGAGIDYTIIHNKENIGVSASRNVGLNVADSDFILFIDPDDWIAPATLEKIYNTAVTGKADIVAFNGVEYYEHEDSYKPMPSLKGTYMPDEYLTYLFNGGTTAHMWLRMVRKELYQGLSFPPDVIFEDFIIVPLLISKANRIIHLEDVLYTYVQRTNQSNLTTNRPPNITLFMTHMASMENRLLANKYINKTLLKKYQFLLLSFILSRLFRCKEQYRDIRNDVNIIRNYITLKDLLTIRTNTDKKAWLILLLTRINGKLSRKLLYQYNSTRTK